VVALVNEQGSQGEGRHEFETQEATIRNDVDGSLGVSRMLKTLADRERMPEWVVDRVRDLRRLRAEADPQGPLLTLPTEAAIGYINSVERLAKFFVRAPLLQNRQGSRLPTNYLIGNLVNRGNGAASSPLTASLFSAINQSRRRWVEAKNFVLIGGDQRDE